MKALHIQVAGGSEVKYRLTIRATTAQNVTNPYGLTIHDHYISNGSIVEDQSHFKHHRLGKDMSGVRKSEKAEAAYNVPPIDSLVRRTGHCSLEEGYRGTM